MIFAMLNLFCFVQYFDCMTIYALLILSNASNLRSISLFKKVFISLSVHLHLDDKIISEYVRVARSGSYDIITR